MYNQYKICDGENYIKVELLIDKDIIIAQNKIVSEYYFEAIVAYGDINNDSRLEIESTESPLYSFSSDLKTKCTLYLSKPIDTDWMVLLKLNCIEDNELAWHSRHYRMAVVAGKPLG